MIEISETETMDNKEVHSMPIQQVMNQIVCVFIYFITFVIY